MLTGLFLLLFAVPPAPPLFALDAPRSWSGVIPCADCEGIRVTLDLFPDQTFALRNEYLGKNRASASFGRWSAEEGDRLALRSGKETPTFFRVVDAETLRQLDQLGREIGSKLNYDLKKDPEFRLVEEPAALLGRFRYMADAGRITLCATAQELPVATEGANAALEKAYGEKKPGPGEPLLVAVTGHLAFRPKMDGNGTELAFVVDTFDRALPGERCRPPLPGEAPPPSTPEGKTWTVVTVLGEKVAGGRGRMAVQLKLDVTGHHVSGSTGCNRLNGRYKLDGDGLTFSDLVTTKMMCPGSMVRERNFLQALEDVTGWKFSGERLQLMGRRQVVVELVEKEED
ncbi:MAG TPA: META domain-containing protein [Thermoanaerobaculia bacterium]|nr:META domain-containing protein [Thermoanaerobaculia bacterium]HQR66989.1 META domain-containing protein [Thermoanaerobaculia bacterium]